MFLDYFLTFVGLGAGFIDSIAGGGGLMTLPVLSVVLEPGASAIGTNKIVGTMGAGIAFLVYLKKNKFHFKNALPFATAVGVGSVMGSRVTPYLSKEFFHLFMICSLPFLFYVVWNKSFWTHQSTPLVTEKNKNTKNKFYLKIGFTGVCVGFYDGFFGPGGGTFMFLGLLFIVQLPLFEALLTSKFVNLISAGFSLMSYQVQGFVHWKEGLWMAFGMSMGAFLGARFTTKNAERIVRPALIGVVSILMLKLILDLY